LRSAPWVVSWRSDIASDSVASLDPAVNPVRPADGPRDGFA
jgi:hypothetical protein